MLKFTWFEYVCCYICSSRRQTRSDSQWLKSYRKFYHCDQWLASHVISYVTLLLWHKPNLNQDHAESRIMFDHRTYRKRKFSVLCFLECLLQFANMWCTKDNNWNVKTRAGSQEQPNSGQTIDRCASGDTHSQAISVAKALEDTAVANTFAAMLDLWSPNISFDN